MVQLPDTASLRRGNTKGSSAAGRVFLRPVVAVYRPGGYWCGAARFGEPDFAGKRVTAARPKLPSIGADYPPPKILFPEDSGTGIRTCPRFPGQTGSPSSSAIPPAPDRSSAPGDM